MKIYIEGNFYHYNSAKFIGTVHKSRIGMTSIGDTHIRISLDLVGARGQTNVQETFLFADCKRLDGVAHGNSYLTTIAGINDLIAPTLVSPIEIISANSEITVKFSEGCYANNDGSGTLTNVDFIVTLTGGVATSPVLSVPIHSLGDSEIEFSLSYTGTANGTEVLTIKPASGASIYDLAGNPMLATSQATVTLEVV